MGKPLRTVRCAVKSVSTTHFAFTCPAGHVTVENINKGKPKHLHLSGSGLELMARWWVGGRNGVAFHCPQCFPKEK